VLLVLSGGAALAQFKVESPRVEQGELELEANLSLQRGYRDPPTPDEDDDEAEAEEEVEQLRQGHEFSIGYGVTDWWRPEIGLEVTENRGERVKVQSVGFENTLALPSREGQIVNGALFLAYEAPIATEAAHAFEFGPIVEVVLDKLTITANPFFEKQFGDKREPGVAFEYGWQTKVEVAAGLSLGFEAFGEIEDIGGNRPKLGDQEHRIGPVAFYEIELEGIGEIGLAAGLLFGLTDATSDYALKLGIELAIEP